MIHLFGNCQVDFLTNALKRRGVQAEYHALATPLGLVASRPSPGGSPHVLTELIEGGGLGDFLHARSLVNQFELLTPGAEPPRLMLFNLFHENEPLFVHAREGWVFYIDPGAMEASPELKRWMSAECQIIQPRPENYLDRFAKMLLAARRRWPDTPMLILGRLSHWPAFGPAPYSYLRGWENVWPGAEAALEELAARLGGCRYVSMDRVFAGIWADDPRIETHCPFLRLEETPHGLLPRRDLEHVGSMWARLAEKLEAVFAGDPSALIPYAEAETIPAEWRATSWTPERPGRDELARLLFSGDNYATARAVGAFFFQPEEDFTDLLLAARSRMPVCHNTLHMLRRYARIKRNKLFLLWIEAHRDKAKAFTHNGLAFQGHYLARLDDMSRELTQALAGAAGRAGGQPAGRPADRGAE